MLGPIESSVKRAKMEAITPAARRSDHTLKGVASTSIAAGAQTLRATPPIPYPLTLSPKATRLGESLSKGMPFRSRSMFGAAKP